MRTDHSAAERGLAVAGGGTGGFGNITEVEGGMGKISVERLGICVAIGASASLGWPGGIREDVGRASGLLLTSRGTGPVTGTGMRGTEEMGKSNSSSSEDTSSRCAGLSRWACFSTLMWHFRAFVLSMRRTIHWKNSIAEVVGG